MCLPIIAAVAVSALASLVSQKMSMDASNNAAAANYNAQARQAEEVNRAAINKQVETDYRSRLETNRNAANATSQAQAAILQNRIAMGTARASAGTSGMMGLPLNLIEQNYQALIGGVGTNLQTQYQQLDENYFFNAQNNAMEANNTTNAAIPGKPQMQKFGPMNFLTAALAGVSGGLGAAGGAKATPKTTNPTFQSGVGGGVGQASQLGPSFDINPAFSSGGGMGR